MEFSVAAPGKVTLVGEYGVRLGGPVLVAAIDRYVRAHVHARDTLGISFSCESDGIPVTPVGEATPESRLLLFASAINTTRGYLKSRNTTLDALHVELDTSEMRERDTHLGIGSSGAAAVAVAAALLGRAGLEFDSPARRWDLLTLAAHTQSVALGAQASGSDVAAAAFGGLTIYRRGGAVHHASLPEGISWAVVRSHGEARTGSMLFRIPGDSGSTASDLDDLVREVARTAERVVDRLEDSAASFLEAVTEFREEVTRLGEETGALTLSPGMQAVIDAVSDFGVVAKPTPTHGDADLGVLISDDPEALQAALNVCAEIDYRPLDLRPEPRGVHAI